MTFASHQKTFEILKLQISWISSDQVSCCCCFLEDVCECGRPSRSRSRFLWRRASAVFAWASVSVGELVVAAAGAETPVAAAAVPFVELVGSEAAGVDAGVSSRSRPARVSECVRTCLLKWSERTNRLPHTGHAKRFSPASSNYTTVLSNTVLKPNFHSSWVMLWVEYSSACSNGWYCIGIGSCVT